MSSLLRPLGILAATALACFYVIVLLKGPQGVPAMMQLRQEVIDLEQQNRRLQDEIEQRRQRVGRLQTDPAERERAVREATKKQKPGETTIFVQE